MTEDERYRVDTRVQHYGGDGGMDVAFSQAQGNAKEVRHKGSAKERVIYYQQDSMSAGVSRGKISDITLKSAYQKTAEATMECIDGSTATTVAVTSDGLLHVANIADSPAMLFVVDAQRHVRAHYLIHDEHDAIPKIAIKPELIGGADIEQVSKVHYPISIARNFGGKPYGLPKTPDVHSFHLDALVKPGETAFLCVASDGIAPPDKEHSKCKEWMGHYAEMLEGMLKRNVPLNAQSISEAIAQEAIVHRRMKTADGQAGEQDNISVMVAHIPPQRSRDYYMNMCDGHRAATLDGSDDMKGQCAQLSAKLLDTFLAKPERAFQVVAHRAGNIR